ncbi:hypothetical protein [Dokdonella sp.]|uniref:hypothetical protein n=1 Tax=Dokdonella sp. TaxID=2291710 RepID=UPI003C570F45
MKFALAAKTQSWVVAAMICAGLWAHAPPAAAQANPSAVTECASNTAMEPCVTRARAMVASQQYRAAADYLEGACIRGARAACDELWPILLEPIYGLRDGARFYSVFEASCKAGSMGSCQDGALVAAGASGSEHTIAYKDYGRVRAFGDPGCAQNRMEACYGLMLLYSNSDSPYRNLDQAIVYARKVCDNGEWSGCTIGSGLIDGLSNVEVATRSADLYALNGGACRAGQEAFCKGLGNIGKMAGRVDQYGPQDAFHMFMVDQAISDNNWGGSVAYAVNEARSPAAIRHAIERASSLGKMEYVAQNDLSSIQSHYTQEQAGQIASTEMARRSGLAGQQNPASAPTQESFADAVAERNRQADQVRDANRGKKLSCYVKDGRRICSYN